MTTLPLPMTTLPLPMTTLPLPMTTLPLPMATLPLPMTTLPLPMTTSHRIQQIIDHERAIQRSLMPFGFALAFITVLLVAFALG
jgi:hypothetical protein